MRRFTTRPGRGIPAGLALRLAAIAVVVLLVPSSALARARHAPKPSIKVRGLSINRFYASQGTTVRAGDSSNGCYIIGGASGEPSELKVYAYVQATSIPASARLSYTFTTPWDRDNLDPGASLFSGPFSHGLFKAYHKQQAELFNGPTGKQDYFTYRMLPSGTPTSQYINGKYLLSVSVKVGGRTLSSRGGVTVAC